MTQRLIDGTPGVKSGSGTTARPAAQLLSCGKCDFGQDGNPTTIKQFDFNGKTFLVDGKDVHEIDRSKVDRRNLTNGQRKLDGQECDGVLEAFNRTLMGDESGSTGQISNIQVVTGHSGSGKASDRLAFLSDEKAPNGTVAVYLGERGLEYVKEDGL